MNGAMEVAMEVPAMCNYQTTKVIHKRGVSPVFWLLRDAISLLRYMKVATINFISKPFLETQQNNNPFVFKMNGADVYYGGSSLCVRATDLTLVLAANK